MIPIKISNSIFRSFVWFCVVLIASSSFVGCECINKLFHTDKPTPTVPQGKAQIPPPNSINISLSSSITDDEIKDRLVSSLPPGKLNTADIVVRRCKCDLDLINLALPNSYTIVIEGSGGPLVVKSGDGATGGDVDLPMSGGGANFRLSLFVKERSADSIRNIYELIRTDTYNPGKTVSIAVFDTGLKRNYLQGSSWQQPTSQCATDNAPALFSSTGWNFTADDVETNTNDNSPIQHGSRVANLIARQFNGGDITPKIVPMKVLSGLDNQGDLFELMCAMETARKNNIRVFNMSLGYYGTEDPLLKKYIQKSVNDKVLIVAAAGNRSNSDVDRNFTTMTPKFYPAGFSKDFEQVITATTVSLHGMAPGNDTLVGCPLQNYGSNNVLGVLQTDQCRFAFAPNGNPTSLIEGSSYATPILTGWLARKVGEDTTHITGWSNLPTLMHKATHGNQLYKNAYLVPWSSTSL